MKSSRPQVLFVSNGHGEDMMAAEITRHLGGADITAYPMVGMGDPYPRTIPLLEPRRTFPSGGFSFRHGSPSLLADLRAGFARFWFAQRATLVAQRGRFDLVVAVGDVYCLVMATCAKSPGVLVATADSVSIGPYGPIHLRILRSRARCVFTRDAATAEYLVDKGVKATFLGNVMLDCLRYTGSDFGMTDGTEVVALLPGSRSEAIRNATILAEVAETVARGRPAVRFLLTMAPTVKDDEMAQVLRERGAKLSDGEASFGSARIALTRAFADAISRATVVVGLAGTANEQAAGLGKPVVAFPGPGPQFTAAFLDAQRKLLGDALLPTSSPSQAAEKVLSLLASKQERVRRGEAGIARMGGVGAAERIAETLMSILTTFTPN